MHPVYDDDAIGDPAVESDLHAHALTGDVDMRAHVAGLPQTSVSPLTMLAGDADAEVRFNVALNAHRGISPSAKEMLRADTDADVRGAIRATDPDAAPDVLAKLAESSNTWVRMNVASHPATPRETLATLASDDNLNVRWSVATNVAVPVELLERFSVDPNEEVNICVVLNGRCPQGIRERLSESANTLIADYAKTALSDATGSGIDL